MTRPARAVTYSFAKTNGVLVTGLHADAAEIAVRENACSAGIAELRRALGLPVRTRRVSGTLLHMPPEQAQPRGGGDRW